MQNSAILFCKIEQHRSALQCIVEFAAAHLHSWASQLIVASLEWSPATSSTQHLDWIIFTQFLVLTSGFVPSLFVRHPGPPKMVISSSLSAIDSYVINPYAMRPHGIGNKLTDNQILGDVLNYRFICSTTRRGKLANTQNKLFSCLCLPLQSPSKKCSKPIPTAK